ncbi:MAG: energy transducer TonB [Saprospiraceae bacterium]|nr:energy transducer TonB [Saprospiraceae bacterium]
MTNTKTTLKAALIFCGFLSFQQISAQDGVASAIVTAKRPESLKTIIQVDKEARFPGCSGLGSVSEQNICAQSRLDDFIEKNLKYPELAKEQDFKPRIVRVELTVDADGRIMYPRVLDGGIREYDLAAQAVFIEMAKQGIAWEPASLNGQPLKTPTIVNVRFSWQGRAKAFPSLGYGDDIFELVDEVPAFASCQQPGLKDHQIKACALEYLEQYFNQNLNYPADAQMVGLEGDIHVDFVVGKDGKVRDVRLKNDLGLGCGEEVKRLFDKMNEVNIGWIPGEEDGQKVNVLLNTTVHFKLKPNQKAKEKLAFVDAKPIFYAERSGYEEFLNNYLKYPKGEDVKPCQFGVFDVKFKVNAEGAVEVTDMLDYNNLGKAYRESIEGFLTETNGEWNTKYANLSAETQYMLTIPIAPPLGTCPDVPTGYKEMVYKAQDGAKIAEVKSKLNDGLELLDKAVRSYPSDNKIRHLRGLVLYKNGRQVEGCVDLSFVAKENKAIEVPKTCK